MIKRIPVNDLEIGMYVVDFDRPWIDTPFLFHKFLIKSTKEIDKIKKYDIRFIEIDTEKGRDHKKAVPMEEVNRKIDENIKKDIKQIEALHSEEMDEIPFEEEIEESKRIYNEAKNVVKNVMNSVRIGKNIDVEKVNGVVDNMIDSLYRNKNTLLSLSRLKDFDEYTFFHSINVSILSLAMGKHMGYPRSDLQIIGRGGLLHDIGKVKIPETIFNKIVSLTEDEFSLIKRHVEFGVDILSSSGDVPQKSLIMASQHHERYDGRGYPKGLAGEQITTFGVIAGLADVFDAVTTERTYQRAKLPYEGLRILYKLKGAFPDDLLEKFIQCMGIFPVGSLVELDTGDIGIVIAVNHKELLQPRVKLIFNRKMIRYQKTIIVDLSEKKSDGSDYQIKVVNTLNPRDMGIDPDKYINALT
ncbi:MAG: HD-GYP domain-containing protein [Nitrospirota bacterium]